MKHAFRNLKNSPVRRQARRVRALARLNTYPFDFWSTLTRNEGKTTADYKAYVARIEQERVSLEARVK